MNEDRKPVDFVLTHEGNADYAGDGLRDYAVYRDLGIAAATHGAVRAHVIRMKPPFVAEIVSKRHFHDVAFQMVYVLQGWIKYALNDREYLIEKGSCWTQPSGIRHAVLGYSDDCELLEIIAPADFNTVET